VHNKMLDGHLDLGQLNHLVRMVRCRRGELPLPTGTGLRCDLNDLRRRQQHLTMPRMPRSGAWSTLPARAGWPFLIRRIGGGGTTGVAGGLGQPCFERGDSGGLLLDDGEQLDDHLAHHRGRLFPGRAVKRKPCWQWDRRGHRTSPSGHATGDIICSWCVCGSCPRIWTFYGSWPVLVKPRA
jgi:hypothetical protein